MREHPNEAREANVLGRLPINAVLDRSSGDSKYTVPLSLIQLFIQVYPEGYIIHMGVASLQSNVCHNADP